MQVEDKNTENNTSKAELLITIKTGLLTQIFRMLIAIAIVLIIVYCIGKFAKKDFFGKKKFIIMLIVCILSFGIITVYAADWERVAIMSLSDYYSRALSLGLSIKTGTDDVDHTAVWMCTEGGNISNNGVSLDSSRRIVAFADLNKNYNHYNAYTNHAETKTNSYAAYIAFIGYAAESKIYGTGEEYYKYKNALADALDDSGVGDQIRSILSVSSFSSSKVQDTYDILDDAEEVRNWFASNDGNDKTVTAQRVGNENVGTVSYGGTTYIGPFQATYPTGTNGYIANTNKLMVKNANGTYVNLASKNIYNSNFQTICTTDDNGCFTSDFSNSSFYIKASDLAQNVENIKLVNSHYEYRGRIVCTTVDGSGQMASFIRGDRQTYTTEAVWTIEQGCDVSVTKQTLQPGTTTVATTDAKKMYDIGDEVVFKIHITNNSGRTINMNVVDTFDTNQYEFFANNDWTHNNGTCTRNVDVGTSGLTLYIKLKLKHNTDDKYYNNVEIKDFKNSSSDSSTINNKEGNQVTDSDYAKAKQYKVSITKTADKTYVETGDEVIYTITVKNEGSGATYGMISDIKLNEIFNASELEYKEIVEGSWTKATDSNVFTYTGGNIAKNGTAVLKLKFKVLKTTATTSATINNKVKITEIKNKNGAIITSCMASGSVFEDDVDINLRTYKVSIEKTADKTYVETGDIVTYTITVNNTGSGDAYGSITNIKLNDIFDASELEYQTTTLATGWTKDPNSNTFTYSGTITKGNSATLTLKFKVIKATNTNATINNKVEITEVSNTKSTVVYRKSDINTMDSGSVFEDDVNVTLKIYKVSITKTADHAYVEPGDIVKYTITVNNTGSGDAYGNITNIKIDEIFETSELECKTTNFGTNWVKATDSYVFTYTGSIAPGGSATLELEFLVKKKSTTNETINNTVKITEIKNKNGVVVYSETATENSMDSASVYEADVDVTLKIYTANISKVIDKAWDAAGTQRADATKIEIGDTVQYKIEVTNNGTDTNSFGKLYTINVSDYFDSRYFAYDSLAGDNWSKVSELPADNQTTIVFKYENAEGLGCGEKATLYVKLKTIDVQSTNLQNDTDLINTVEIKTTDNVLNENNEDIRSVLNGNLKAEATLKLLSYPIKVNKYISKVDTKNITGRDAKTIEERANEPVETEKGNLVTYTIKVENPGNAELKNIKIKDTLPEGLEFKDAPEGTGRSYEVEIAEVAAGASQTVDLVCEVTKTNMYLLSLENTIEVTQVKNRNGFELISRSLIIYKENKNKEYIRLKDLVISGNVWVDANKNGLQEDTETKLSGIKVNLHDVTNNKVASTTTNADGFYIFNTQTKGKDKATGNDSTEWMIKDGRVVKATKKNQTSGTYSAESVYIQYYVEFEYDGLVYRSTEAYEGQDNLNVDGSLKNENYKIDSNAAELNNNRTDFNKNYEIIAFNKAYNSDKSHVTSLEYNKNKHNSSIIPNHARVMTAQSFVNSSNQTINYLWLYNTQTDYKLPETEYLKYINLGLTEREDMDISIAQDVYEVRTTINGDRMIYDYNQNDFVLEPTSDIDKLQDSSIGEKFNTELYMTGYENDDSSLVPYDFKLYRSDYNYRVSQYKIDTIRNYKGTESELNIETTFRIKVRNNVGTDGKNAYVGINEIVQYYDEDLLDIVVNESTGVVEKFNVKVKGTDGFLRNETLDIVSAKYVMKDGSTDNVVLSKKSSYNTERTIDGYSTLYMRPVAGEKLAGNRIIGEGESFDILITFSVDDSSANYNNLESAAMNIFSVTEISAYSTYYKNASGQYVIAAILDKDSNPGNFGEKYSLPDDKTVDSKEYTPLFEDDTYKTGLKISLQEKTKERELTGFVWNDARTEKIENNGTQYLGDGIYDTSKNAKTRQPEAQRNEKVSNKEEKDIAIQDMKVQLVEMIAIPEPDGIGTRVYEHIANINEEVSISRTASNGKYNLKGYIPGNYVVRFNYGDSSNENALLYNGQDYKSTLYQVTEAKYAEHEIDPYEVLKILEKQNISDAKDDEIRRLETIAYSETMTNDLSGILRGKDTTNAGALTKNTNMISDTAEFIVKTEREDGDKERLNYAETIEKFALEKRYQIKNIEFGVEYRPEAQVALNKYISNIKVLTSDLRGTSSTESLVDAVFNEYYGIVVNTNIDTGVTTFLEDGSGNIVRVKRNASTGDIEDAAEEAGVRTRLSTCKKSDDGKYVVTLAGTELDKEKSVGLMNLQFVENEYDGSGAQGFVYLNIDDEIMQGASISVEYVFAASNLSEIDRVSSNLSNIRFKENEATATYKVEGKYYDQAKIQLGQTTGYIDPVYSAAMTARNKLFSEYYKYELKADNTIKKLNEGTENEQPIFYRIQKKNINVDTNKKVAADNTYYGRYLGSVYYTGVLGDKDVIAELKIDKILDYVDNDLVFDNRKNNGENNLWKTTTSKELWDSGLISKNAFKTIEGEHKLVDPNGRVYDTTERSNLAILLDDRIKDYTNPALDKTVNKDISKYLKPRYASGIESFGTVYLMASKTIAAEESTEDMTYENIGEIIQYSSVTGRVTNLATTIGNVDFYNASGDAEKEWTQAKKESDTAATEKITLTPPTGLETVQRVIRNTVEGASYTLIILFVGIILCAIVYIGMKAYRSRRIK